MMMINVPWHFKVGACAKGKKKNTRREPLFTRIIILKHLLVGSLSHKFKTRFDHYINFTAEG